MTSARRAVILVALVGVASICAGCPSKPSPPSEDEVLRKMREHAEQSGQGDRPLCQPAPLEIFLQAESQLNLNEDGQPMPVEVRVLLLRDRETFDQLDFDTVWKDAQTALTKDLVSSASLTVFPGKLKIYPMKSAPGVTFVALVGIYRRPQGRSWKYVIDVKEQNRRCATSDDLHTIVHASLRGNTITKPE
jgi:type VI secretion system protein VasD